LGQKRVLGIILKLWGASLLLPSGVQKGKSRKIGQKVKNYEPERPSIFGLAEKNQLYQQAVGRHAGTETELGRRASGGKKVGLRTAMDREKAKEGT